jgi:two-component system phosphate regulon response regulator PhoB
MPYGFDADLREFFRTALMSAGFEVRIAADGWQAMQRLDALTPDVIVLDLNLPGPHGLSVLTELTGRAQTRDIPVVVVTGTTATPQFGNVSCVLRKPVTAERLIAVVERCLTTKGTDRRRLSVTSAGRRRPQTAVPPERTASRETARRHPGPAGSRKRRAPSGCAVVRATGRSVNRRAHTASAGR